MKIIQAYAEIVNYTQELEKTLELGVITVRFVNDRGISHEEVCHRLSSFSQESILYCNYSKDGFGNEITVIDPRTAFPGMTPELYDAWLLAMQHAEYYYLWMINHGASPQLARSVLPNSLKTELVWTAKPSEWLHIFRMRCSKQAHPQIRELMVPLRDEFIRRWPAIFDVLAQDDEATL